MTSPLIHKCPKGHLCHTFNGGCALCVQCLRDDLDAAIKRIDVIQGGSTLKAPTTYECTYGHRFLSNRADKTCPFCDQSLAAPGTPIKTAMGAPVIESCDAHGHRYYKEEGVPQGCPHCLMDGLERARLDHPKAQARSDALERVRTEEAQARADESDASAPGTCRKRYEDMSRLGCIQLIKRDNGDIILRTITDPHMRTGQEAWVGFCAQSGSPEVMTALRGLMVAIASDNKTNPQTRDHQG